MNDKLNEIATYCRERIGAEDYDLQRQLALNAIGRDEQIDWNFAHEIENYATEWAEENGYAVDFLDGIDVEEIVLWAE